MTKLRALHVNGMMLFQTHNVNWKEMDREVTNDRYEKQRQVIVFSVLTS